MLSFDWLANWIILLTPAQLRQFHVSIDKGIIEYLGHVEDVTNALRACSVYVLPSYYQEGLPRSILEAMSMGRPIITTDWTGCRETVEAGLNGFLVKPQSVSDLTMTIQQVLDDPNQETLLKIMGEHSRKLVERDHDVRLINASIMAILFQS